MRSSQFSNEVPSVRDSQDRQPANPTLSRRLMQKFHNPIPRRKTIKARSKVSSTSRDVDTIMSDCPSSGEPQEKLRTQQALQTSRLLGLPYELRQRIYTHALVADMAFLWPQHPEDTRRSRIAPALLRTCSQVYKEAITILYKHNRFTFSNPSDANIFAYIKPIQPVTHIAFRVVEKDIRLWNAYLTSIDRSRSFSTDFPNLRNLVVIFRQGWWNTQLSAEQNLDGWMMNERLMQFCMALQNCITAQELGDDRRRASPDITVVSSIKMTRLTLQTVHQECKDMFVAHGNSHLRTRTMDLHGIKTVLELNCPTEDKERAIAQAHVDAAGRSNRDRAGLST